MKTIINSLGSLALILVTIFSFTQCQKDIEFKEMNRASNNQGNAFVEDAPYSGMHNAVANTADVCACLDSNFQLQKINETEKNAILFMREEEKLARDVYDFLYEEWGTQIFDNISRSEEHHMQALLCLINRYGLEDPVGGNGPGKFNNEQLTTLYETLIADGTTNLAGALAVGAIIEDLDIYDLVRLSTSGETDNEDVLAVFEELTKGSRNHLRAFLRKLTQYGVRYTPTYISEKTFAEIVNSDRETGSQLCSGVINCPNNGDQARQCLNNQDETCSQDCTGAGPVGSNGFRGGH